MAEGLLTTCGLPVSEADAKAVWDLYDWHYRELRLARTRLERAQRKGHHHKFAVLKTAIRIHEHARRVLGDALDDLPF